MGLEKLALFLSLTLLLIGTQVLLASSLDSTTDATVNDTGHGSTEEETHEVDKCAEHEENFASDVHIAKLEFERLQTLFIVTIFIMVVVLAKLVWHHKWMHPVASNIPESCMLIVVGAHIGGIILGVFFLDECQEGSSPPLTFPPDIFFLYLLPPIVLESGYFLDNRAFFENLVTILVYAVIGTLFNAFALGMTLFGLRNIGVVLTGAAKDVNFSVSSALLFGTICAAVDPVAVLAVFDEIHVNKLLHILVFGESLLNDAVTIVLFKVLGAFANRPFDESLTPDQRNIDVGDIFLGIAQFVVVVLASVVIGFVVGMVAAFISRFSEHVHVLEPIIVFTMGYLSYILADLFEFSGIVSLIFCAITMKHYVEANISRKSSTTIKYALKVVSNVSEMIIFLFLGVSLYDHTVQNWDWGLSLFTAFFAFIYRPIGVVVLTLIINIFRVRKIGFKSVFVMSYSGLRGAVAFSLALSRIYSESTLDQHPNEFILRKTMFTAVTFLVLFTVFVQGITIKPLVRLIKVKTAEETKPSLNEVVHGTAIDHVMAGVEEILGHFGHNQVREKIQTFDSKYLRKIFERYPEARDEQILHTFRRLQYKESQLAAEKNLVFEYHPQQGEKNASHISLHEQSEYDVRPFSNGEQTGDDDIPTLNDILAASFVNPHEDHYGHVLAMTDRENAEDHHFEPVSARAGLIKAKRNRRKIRRLRRQRFSRLMKAASNFSLDSSRTDKTGKTEKSSDVDADVSDQDIEPFGDQMAIPISDLSSPIAGYSPPAIFTHQTSITEIGDIPISSSTAPVTYRPGMEEDNAAIVLSEFQKEDSPVVLQTSKETDV